MYIFFFHLVIKVSEIIESIICFIYFYYSFEKKLSLLVFLPDEKFEPAQRIRVAYLVETQMEIQGEGGVCIKCQRERMSGSLEVSD